MKISCQNCSSKYTVSDEKVQGKTVKLKCKKCGATILVNAGGATTVASGANVADHPSSPGDAASADGTSYLVNVADGDQRTMTVTELVSAYQSQVVTADTYVWADGMGDWQPLGQVEAIVAALNGGTPSQPPVATPPPAAAVPAAASSAEAMASAASLAASARPAARREPQKRADVFGNEKNDDVATSAPLFSASARAAASNAAAAAKSSAPREENSVLFSLNALTSKSATQTPAPSAVRKDSREDSGLIDLRALAAAAQEKSKASAPSIPPVGGMGLGGDEAGLFPLGVPAAQQPAAPPVAATVTAPPPASKAPMFIGIGALVAALAIVGVFFAMKSDDKPVTETAAQPTITATAAQPTATATATAEPAPTAEASATPTASASSTAVAKGGTSKGGTSKGGTSTGSTSKGGTSTTAAAPASTPAGKPKGNCGCAAGDLMCAMKCSAGGK
ncbi:MAG: zinc-ribbon domain-containing protein [Polyangiaceae bacterium]|nr:zinc-ribbon domain-containing protein [Polyangiaceae bacterium]